MTHAKENKIDAFLAQIECEKASESIDGPFLIKSLKTFGFGENFIKWVSILYNDIKACVGNNGYYSNYFQLSRSIRQGCPILILIIPISSRNNSHMYKI